MSIRRLLLIFALVGGAVVGGILFADTVLLPWLIHGQSEVIVPDLVGLSVGDATRRAEDIGLSLHVYDEVFQEGVPPGQVIEQIPASLGSVRRGRPVRVAISKGEAMMRVPDLTGMSVRQSELTLLREGLVLGRVARAYDPRGGLGVVAQRPHPGSEVSEGDPVELLVREALERPHHRMPAVVGRNLVRVRDELSRAGFELRRVTYRADADAFPGTILDQSPPAGSRVPAGGSIELVASSRN